MALKTELNPRPVMPAGNPIDFMYSSENVIPTPQNFEVWKLDIAGNTDLCGKKITIMGKDYFFVIGGQDDTRAYAFFLGTDDFTCGGIVQNTYCEIAASIATGINNNPNTNATYICLPAGESVQITNAPLYAISQCNEAVAPYITLFVLAKQSGIGLGITTDSTDISLTLLQSGTTGIVSNEPYKAITQIEVEQCGHNTGTFVRCPLYATAPIVLPNISVVDNSIQQNAQQQVSYAKGFATNNKFFFLANVQSACQLFFAEDLPKLDTKTRQCLNSIKNVRAKKAEFYADAYTKFQRADTIRIQDFNKDYVFAVLNAQFQNFKQSMNIQQIDHPTLGCVDLYAYPYVLAPYFSGVVGFLQSIPAKNISLSDWEWLYFYNSIYSIADMLLVAEVTYSQPVDLGMGYVTQATYTQAIDLSTSDCEYSGTERNHLYQVPIHSIFADIEQPEYVGSVCVHIQCPNLPELTDTRITEKYTYQIKTACSNETLLFQNHLGQFETMFFNSINSHAIDLERSKLYASLQAGILKNEITLQTLARESYEIESADGTNLEQIKAILQSPSIYWLETKTETYTRCNCNVTACEQDARNLMNIWQADIVAWLVGPTPSNLCDTGIGWLGAVLEVSGRETQERFIQNSCYEFYHQCVDALGDTIIYAIAKPLNAGNRAYITMYFLDTLLNLTILGRYESNVPTLTIPTLTGGVPMGYHLNYQDFADRCVQDISTQELTPIAILDKSVVLEDAKTDLPILRLRFEKQENLALKGGTNE